MFIIPEQLLLVDEVTVGFPLFRRLAINQRKRLSIEQ